MITQIYWHFSPTSSGVWLPGAPSWRPAPDLMFLVPMSSFCSCDQLFLKVCCVISNIFLWDVEGKNKNEQEVDKGGGDTQILKEISPTG